MRAERRLFPDSRILKPTLETARMFEQPGAAAEEDRGQMNLDLVHQAGGKALLIRAGPVYGDHFAPCRSR
jgi:hypothetical protein